MFPEPFPAHEHLDEAEDVLVVVDEENALGPRRYV
jgi:hypothetical protein